MINQDKPKSNCLQVEVKEVTQRRKTLIEPNPKRQNILQISFDHVLNAYDSQFEYSNLKQNNKFMYLSQ